MALNNNLMNVDLGMEGIGMDVSGTSKQANESLKKGMCPTCGVQTHKIERGPFLGKKKIPLTVGDDVVNGTCIKCHPMEPLLRGAILQESTYQRGGGVSPVPESQNAQIPNVLEVRDTNSDDCTVISAITMDHHLLKEFGGDDDSDTYSEENYKVAPGQRRPAQSFGERDDDCPRPDAPRRSGERVGSFRLASMSKQRSCNRNSSRFKPLESDVFAPIQEETSFSVQSSGGRRAGSAAPVGEECKVEIKAASTSDKGSSSTSDHERKMPSSEKDAPSSTRSWVTNSRSDGQILGAIPPLLKCLEFDSIKSGHREEALQSLTEIVWKLGATAKEAIAGDNGIEIITNSMWSSIDEPGVQEASVHLLFALSASSNSDGNSDVIVRPAGERAVDALLIAMQSHIKFESIQHSGCGALSCLAAASNHNTEVNDGSLTGAVITVVNAMDEHRTSRRVQEWGLRALYNQCVYSYDAESNMRTLVMCEINNHVGPEIIYCAVQFFETDMMIVELACRLYWCLSSSEDVSALLCESPLPFQEIVRVIQLYHMNPAAAGLLEAAFGALGNFFNLKQNQDLVCDSAIVTNVVESMRIHSGSIEICTEGLALIANFSSCSRTEELFAGADVFSIFQTILRILQTFPDTKNLPLYEEAIRTLTCLSIDLPEMRRYICSRQSLSFLLLVSKRNQRFVPGQISVCHLLGSIFVDRELTQEALANDGLIIVITAMEAHPEERKVQEAACLALRNLACHEKDEIEYLTGQPLNLLLEAMKNHKNSETIQLNACCALWNITSKLEGLDDTTITQVVDYIVQTIQTHLVSSPILEMACAALWSVSVSHAGKKRMVESGGIDAVTCIFLMHLHEPKTLERACGVLSSVSASPPFANAIADAHAVGSIVEAMKTNGFSTVLLEFGSLVLRNIILARPDHATEASNIAATLISEMRKKPEAVGFQREACNLLWAMATLSKHCKEKILEMDGFDVVVGCLEHNSSYPDVQHAALGAFNQLTTS